MIDDMDLKEAQQYQSEYDAYLDELEATAVDRFAEFCWREDQQMMLPLGGSSIDHP